MSGEKPARQPMFKQYRENDGKFYFKLLDGDGRVLLQSIGFVSPKEAGAIIATIKAGTIDPGSLDNAVVRDLGVDEVSIAAALRQLQESD